MANFDDYLRRFKEIQRIIDQTKPQLSAFETIPLSVREQMLQLASARAALPPDYLQKVARIGESVAEGPAFQLKVLAASENEAVREMLRRQHELDSQARQFAESTPYYSQFSRPMLDSLVRAEALLETSRIREDILDAALQPQRAFQEFARQQFELASAAISEVVKRNRLALVDIAAELLEDMGKGFELAALMNAPSPALYSTQIPVVNLYAELAVDLEHLGFEGSAEVIEEAVLDSGPGQVAQLGGRLVELVYNLNMEAEREGRSPVFKPTNKNLYGCSVIPTQVATDARSFEEIVDYLYFLLYEGSGDAKRLTERYPPSSLGALWILKSLRKGARHDVDHGARKDVEAKNLQIGETFQSLIGSAVPRTRADWIQAQVSLYGKLVDMLEDIWFGDPLDEAAN